ncbi:MAG: hypothetical protein P1P67_04295 [Treponema phagedenis]|nr:hypothetical protein [Treponema phagedenis]NVP24012.1 hypothetical protein [Treponema phagedenis]QKS91242.1 hypothetical protein HPJ96_00680 [Treponema phagedenis]TYT78851.1 hypothetical protein FS559_06845 [Treponema phagedenis]
MEKEVLKLIQDIRYEADLAISMFDTKQAELDKAIKEADKKLRLLNKEMEINKTALNTMQKLDKQVTNQNLQKESSLVNFGSENKLSVENPPLAASSQKTQTQEEPITIYTKRIIQDNAVKTGQGTVNEQILEMAKKGFSPEFIANKVGMTFGEIQLIIGLNS